MQEIWQRQRTQFARLAEEEGFPILGERGSLSSALAFAELLSRCSSEASARRLLHENRADALSFLEVASQMTRVIQTSTGKPSTAAVKGPFHEFADLAIELLTLAIDENPEG